MPYALSLDHDRTRGGHRYRATIEGELEPDALRELSAWLADAKQNPDASFVIDLTGTTGASRRGRAELRALLRRHRDLRSERRLSVLPRRGGRGRATLAPIPS